MKKLRKLPKRTIIFFIVCSLIILFLILRTRSKSPTFEYYTVRRGDVIQTVSAPGILSGRSVSNVRFKTAGRLIYLGVRTGDTVRKGQFIAAIDNKDLSISLQQAMNTLRDRQATLENIYDQVKSHAADETPAQKAVRTTAEVNKDNAYDNVRLIQKQISDTRLYAPLSGVVINQDDIVAGQNVNPSEIIAQITDISKPHFSAEVDESDIGKIKINQEVDVVLNAYETEIVKGRVSEIAPQTNASTNGGINVRVLVELKTANFKPIYGLNGEANIIVALKRNVLIIPQSALISEDEVYIRLSRERHEKRKIEAGLMTDTDVEVTAGLNEDDVILINPQALEGAR